MAGRRVTTKSVTARVDRSRHRTPLAVLFVLVLASVTACGRHEFVPYAPTADLVPVLDGSTLKLGGHDRPLLASGTRCDEIETFYMWDPGPNASEWRAVTQAGPGRDRSRVVSFATLRLETRKEVDGLMDQFREAWIDECPDIDADAEVPHVPVSLDGLPDGALTTHWLEEDRDGYTTVIADRDRKIIMIGAWVEQPDAVPTDAFVDVVNAAWSDFEERNS